MCNSTIQADFSELPTNSHSPPKYHICFCYLCSCFCISGWNFKIQKRQSSVADYQKISSSVLCVKSALYLVGTMGESSKLTGKQALDPLILSDTFSISLHILSFLLHTSSHFLHGQLLTSLSQDILTMNSQSLFVSSSILYKFCL